MILMINQKIKKNKKAPTIKKMELFNKQKILYQNNHRKNNRLN